MLFLHKLSEEWVSVFWWKTIWRFLYSLFLFLDTSTKEVTFETHKVPREAWVGEIEAVEAKIQKEKEQQEKEQKEREEREKELNKTVSICLFDILVGEALPVLFCAVLIYPMQLLCVSQKHLH